MQSRMTTTVLCVDGDDDDRSATADALADAGLGVHTAASVAEATDALGPSIDCVVTEYTLPDGTGLDLIAGVRGHVPDTPCVLFTDDSPEDIDTTAFESVVVEYLSKGSSGGSDRLTELVDTLLARRSQVGYPLPPDEDGRLAALAQYDVAELETVTALDRLTELAARHFDVDRAFVGIVTEHEERFVSCHGGELEPLDREDTMCTHAILEDDLLVVPDVREDDRFEHNDALDRLNIRSYAGAPVRTPDGAALGSFCLTDGDARTYSADDRTYLRLLADEVEEQLDLRSRLREAGRADE
ncbi:GAF domain-containing protein [Halorientalis litorea]|jgi:CheY-like chemotaxis protein|uniref:GAF domain-containing protein n=1 Tax=Halorientalis litorea TaxID=2931977 RepID=UPI001FF67E15|nr:GAF domain-containing protein [Halorientalis litorea]